MTSSPDESQDVRVARRHVLVVRLAGAELRQLVAQLQPVPKLWREADLLLLVQQQHSRHEGAEGRERLRGPDAPEVLGGDGIVVLEEAHETETLAAGVGQLLPREPLSGPANPTGGVGVAGDLAAHHVERVVKQHVRGSPRRRQACFRHEHGIGVDLANGGPHDGVLADAAALHGGVRAPPFARLPVRDLTPAAAVQPVPVRPKAPDPPGRQVHDVLGPVGLGEVGAEHRVAPRLLPLTVLLHGPDVLGECLDVGAARADAVGDQVHERVHSEPVSGCDERPQVLGARHVGVDAPELGELVDPGRLHRYGQEPDAVDAEALQVGKLGLDAGHPVAPVAAMPRLEPAPRV